HAGRDIVAGDGRGRQVRRAAVVGAVADERVRRVTVGLVVAEDADADLLDLTAGPGRYVVESFLSAVDLEIAGLEQRPPGGARYRGRVEAGHHERLHRGRRLVDRDPANATVGAVPHAERDLVERHGDEALQLGLHAVGGESGVAGVVGVGVGPVRRG